MLKTLKKSIREYKAPSILTPIFVGLEVVVECLIPFVMSKLITIIEMSSGKETLSQILIYGAILILMAGVSLLFGILSGRFCAKASCGYAKNLREDLFTKVQSFSFESIDKFSSSSLVTRLTTDVSNVQNAYMMIIRLAVRAPLMFIFAMCMSFYINVKMSLIFVVVVPVLVFGLVLIISKALPKFNRSFKKYDNLNAVEQENIKGMRVVKAYVREDYEIKKFNRSSNDICRDFTKAEKIVALTNPLMTFCVYVAMLGVSYFGAKLIINTMGVSLTVGELSSLITYGTQILSSFMMLSFVFVMCSMAYASSKRIVEVLNENSKLRNPKNPITEVKDGSVEFKNVYFKYNEKAEKFALSNVNLKIESGQTIGIVGGTGSSKTTLVSLISRLYDVTEGELLVGGENVKKYDLESLRNSVAVVLQKNVLFTGTIKDNLRWGKKDATDEEMIKACKIAGADEFITSFPNGYDTKIEQGGANVSGGQKQRLTIARALLKSPKILILDDSTSAVDTKTDAVIRKGFKEYLPGTTKIIIAQRIASVQDSDLILVMDGGHIENMGTHEELLQSSDIYKEIYNTQNKVGGKNE